MTAITPSQQHYIKAIYELSFKGEGVRVSDIAVKLAVTKSSACIAMKNLQKNGLVRRDEHRLVFLTEKGERQAILTLDRLMVIQQFLVGILGVKQEIAETDACAIEHVISVDTLCSLCQFNNRTAGERHCKGGCHVAPCDTLWKDERPL